MASADLQPGSGVEEQAPEMGANVEQTAAEMATRPRPAPSALGLMGAVRLEEKAASRHPSRRPTLLSRPQPQLVALRPVLACRIAHVAVAADSARRR